MDWKKYWRWMGYVTLASFVQLAIKPAAQWWFVPVALLVVALPCAGLVWIDGWLIRRQSRKVGGQ